MSESLVKKALKETGSDPFTYWYINTRNSLSEYFLRNDLLDPTSDDRHLVASSRVLMTSEEDPKASVRFWPEIMLQEQLLQEQLLQE